MSNIIIVEQQQQKYTIQQLCMLELEALVELDKINKILDDVFKKCEQDLLDGTQQN